MLTYPVSCYDLTAFGATCSGATYSATLPAFFKPTCSRDISGPHHLLPLSLTPIASR